MDTDIESRIAYESPVAIWQSESRFRIPGVVYRGQQRNYLLFEEMSPEMMPDKLIKLYESEKAKGNPVPTDAPLIWAIATRAYELINKNPEEAERLKDFLRTGFRRYPNTLTRIHYFSTNDVFADNDSVVHNGNSDRYSLEEDALDTSDRYCLKGNVVGPNGRISEIPDKNVLKALLGTQDISQINSVSQWINGTDFYIWRLNSEPEKFTKRAARLYINDCRLDLDCCGDLSCKYPAFRVLRVE